MSKNKRSVPKHGLLMMVTGAQDSALLQERNKDLNWKVFFLKLDLSNNYRDSRESTWVKMTQNKTKGTKKERRNWN